MTPRSGAVVVIGVAIAVGAAMAVGVFVLDVRGDDATLLLELLLASAVEPTGDEAGGGADGRRACRAGQRRRLRAGDVHLAARPELSAPPPGLFARDRVDLLVARRRLARRLAERDPGRRD